MIDLALWSLTIALTPLGLDLAFRLIRTVEDQLHPMPRRALGPARPARSIPLGMVPVSRNVRRES